MQRARVWFDAYVPDGTTEEHLTDIAEAASTLGRTAAARAADVDSDLAPDPAFGAHFHLSNYDYACEFCRLMSRDSLNHDNITNED